MDVLLGPTFTLDVPSSPPPPYDAAPSHTFFPADSSESSSSIGTPDHSDDDDENDAVSSKRNENEEHEEVHTKLKTLPSLDSVKEALPINRGLSNHFVGKSKSFSDLSQVNTVKELEKQENPFNKRRKVLMTSKLLTKRSSFYVCSDPKSMPLLPVCEDYDNEEGKEKPKKVSPSSTSSQVPMSYVSRMRHSLGSFKCRSLSDLKEHDDEEEENQDEDNDD